MAELATGRPAAGHRGRGAAVRKDVVAVVLSWRERLALFKRSELVDHDRGLWHCITGYLDDPGAVGAPRRQALLELYEETGLGVADLTAFAQGPTIELLDGEVVWMVHTFRADTTRRRLELNWEHDAYRWVRRSSLPRFCGQVAWLGDVVGAVTQSERHVGTHIVNATVDSGRGHD